MGLQAKNEKNEEGGGKADEPEVLALKQESLFRDLLQPSEDLPKNGQGNSPSTKSTAL